MRITLTSLAALGSEETHHGTMTAEDQVVVSTSAKVVDIDKKKRELTLKTSAGEVTPSPSMKL